MEIWKDIPNYEGIYQVSNLGRIKSLDRHVNSGLRYNNKVIKKGKILKQNLKRDGYLSVDLSRDNIVKTISVHRIVSNTFLEKIEGKEIVNHKNGIKTDNRVENLEWCTSKENTIHAIKTGLIKPNKNRKKIRCKQTNKIFESSYEAGKWLNESKFKYSKDVSAIARKIRACCIGKQKVAYGYTWEDFDKNFND